MTIKILVEISGGVVTSIYSSDPDNTEITLIDWDNVSESLEEIVSGEFEPEELTDAKLQSLIDEANETIQANNDWLDAEDEEG